jgi:transposase
MDTSNSAGVDVVAPSHGLSPLKRQHRSPELKRQIVEATFIQGASVARVARAYGVNTNQVYAWRRGYQQGLLKRGKGGRPELLAVHVAEGGAEANPAPTCSPGTGVIQVELPKGHLRLTGSVDPEALRVVLGALLG